MQTRAIRYLGVSFGVAVSLAALVVGLSAAQTTTPAVAIGETDIGGTVTSMKGPEGGVWVIAETSDLPTKYVKIVVTDDQGRYVLPELPKANYNVWVRGYGLVDSPKVDATPGRNLDLTAVVAPSLNQAAQYYPAGYWFSLLQIPATSEFPGTGPDGNGISPSMASQAEWIKQLKTGGSGCAGSCHLIGTKATREIEPELAGLGSSVAAWERRTQFGQNAPDMIGALNQLGTQRALSMFADWSDRIAGGQVPMAPNRPQGIERNLVITEWDWADPTGYLHDEVSTDKRNPTVNAFGPIYGAMEFSHDYSPVLDPVRNETSRVELTVEDPNTRPAAPQSMLQPWRYWGDEIIWTSKTNTHNPMFDDQGRVWFTSVIRPPENPTFCQEGSSLPSAQRYPLSRGSRQLAMYDPSTGQMTHIDTCFGTHHIVFAEDSDNTAWFSGGGDVIGWFDTRKFLETGDAQASQGWTPLILDTVGDGQPHDYVGPDQPVDPTMDKQVVVSPYGIGVAPDGIVWVSYYSTFPGGIVRLDPGPNPPETALAELYEVPWNNPDVPSAGFSPRGMDVDRNGVVWLPLASGHLASFDRRKCQGPLSGPTATGQQCPEGWMFYPEPLPPLTGEADSGTAGGSYYTWVDQFNTLGLGDNVPINTGQAAEALLALKDGQWVQLRVPYPMGFFSKWMDGRIDDPNAGWKGRGLYATNASRPVWHMETGEGTTSKVYHFQLRPDPLAR